MAVETTRSGVPPFFRRVVFQRRVPPQASRTTSGRHGAAQPRRSWWPAPTLQACIQASPSHRVTSLPPALDPKSSHLATQGCVPRPLCAGDTRPGATSKDATVECCRRLSPLWWAWLDLNQRPHPYQQYAGNRCANCHSRRSHSTVDAEVMCSHRVQLCALIARHDRAAHEHADSASALIASSTPESTSRRLSNPDPTQRDRLVGCRLAAG
jgi:hypothetical protein